MFSFNSKIYSTFLSLLGYKKIPLPDTKGVLNSINNFKYYRESIFHNASDTILPSGTKVSFRLDDFDTNSKEPVKETLIIKKANGQKIKAVRVLGKNELKIFKNGNLFTTILK